jgi:hypothetical protein
MIPIPFPKVIKADVIKITMAPTANFVVGINLTFVSGTITIDWKDGSAPENFVSGIKKTHTYLVAGTYVAEVSGNLTNITGITIDSNKMTKIENLTTGILTRFVVSANPYNAAIDMSKCRINTGASEFVLDGMTTITELKFAQSGNVRMGGMYAGSSKIYGSLDLSSLPIGGSFNLGTQPEIISVLFSSTNNLKLTTWVLIGSKLTTADFTNVPIENLFYMYNNTNLTSIIFASSGNGALKDIRLYGCNLDYINFTTGGFNLAANNCSIQLQNNGMVVGDVNHVLVDLDSIATSGYTGRVINIGGTNADPDSSSGGYDGLSAKASLEAKGFTVTI